MMNERVVLIIGAAGNLGVSVARTFLKTSAHLVLIDRTSDHLANLFPELASNPNHLLAHSVDITVPSLVDQTITETIKRFKRIDVLINTAGGYRAGAPLDETPLSDWDFLFNLNARSTFIACHAVIPQMRKQNYGKIVNIASRAALRGEANAALYSASKSVVVRLTESLAAELGEAGINVNCILPGIIDTPPNRHAMPNADYSRWVTPESLAEVILFLASDAARDINGASIPVYGKS